MKLRSIRPPPPDDITPNPNDPAQVPPSTVGPDQLVTPGDPHGVTVDVSGPATPLARIIASGWSGWPADWWPPAWNNGGMGVQLTPTASTCLDLNSSVLASMPPYLVGAADSLDTGWLTNPDPDTYTSWDEFAKTLFWDYQLGEAFVLCTARYATDWPARFHCVPTWAITVELDNGARRYEIGSQDVTADILHIRYRSTVSQAHGIGPLDAAGELLMMDRALSQYAAGFAAQGGVPSSILTHPDRLEKDQSDELKAEWVTARQNAAGGPAVLSGGIDWKPTQANPRDMALVDLQNHVRAQIAQLFGVPPPLLSIPVGDSQTYRNVKNFHDFHWRQGLRPRAQAVMAALSGWLLPRGTQVELNRDAYIEPEPLERAQVAQIYANIKDAQGNPVLTVQQIQQIERMQIAGAAGVPPPAESAGT